MKIRIIYCLIAVLLFSCDEEEPVFPGFIDVGFGFVVIDDQGTDLLDPANENSYKEDSIDIYSLIDGVKTIKYGVTVDSPKSFRINYSTYHNLYVMTLYLNSKMDENNKAITYVQWNSAEEDKFECEYMPKETPF